MKNRYWLTLAIAVLFILLCYRYPSALNNSLFLLWISVLFHRRFNYQVSENARQTFRMISAGGIYMGIVLGLFFLTRQFKWLVVESKVVLDFENILRFDKSAYANIISALLLTIACFIFSHRMMLDIFRTGLARNARLVTLVAVLGGSYFLVPLFNLSFPAYQMVLISLVYLLLFDLYIDSRTTSLTWLISWLFVISIFTAFVFYKYNLDRDTATRLELAKELAVLQDSTAEAQLLPLLEQAFADDSLELYFTAPIPFTFREDNIRRVMDGFVRPMKYFSKVYAYDIFVLNEKFRHSFIEGANASRGFGVLEKVKDAPFGVLLGANGYPHGYAYVSKNRVPIPGDTAAFNTVLFCARPAPEMGDDFKGLNELGNYHFGVYHNDNLVWENKEILLGDSTRTLIPDPGGWTEVLSGPNANVIYSSLDNVTVIIGREVGGFYRPMTLFSFVFSLFIFAVIFLSVLNYYLKALPLTQEFPLFWGPSLRNKVQLYIIVLMLCSFFVMGLVTTISFRNSMNMTASEPIEELTSFEKYDQEKELYSFWENLLNVYVFLLLITAAIGILVANRIADPLVRMVEKLKGTNLNANEPLQWDSDDEIGELVKAYNNMIGQLEDSAQKLKQSEREGAWREMAKQVAHEIKNPLTPMKLHLQHLKRVFDTDPEQAKPMMERVSKTLIEQIDGLSLIASEFSNFAQMPQAENTTFVLNHVLDSVHQLFQKEAGEDMLITLDLCTEKLSVFADREQMMRVFNNLIKNAIQSIPEDRIGDIYIVLEATESLAIVKIVDNGEGIPEDKREQVFQPSFTTKNSGMGLGLAMSKNIVETANGRIWFETEEGNGTTFFVELPRVAN